MPRLLCLITVSRVVRRGMRHLPVVAPVTWIWRPGMGRLLERAADPEPPSLLAVVSMRELCQTLIAK